MIYCVVLALFSRFLVLMSNDNYPGNRRWRVHGTSVLPHKRDVLDVVVLCVVGTLWHFLFGVTGNTYLFGLVAPVNESLWEHGKLGLGATLMLLVVDGIRLHKLGGRLPLVSRAAGLIVMNTFIIVIFLIYTWILSTNILALDIFLYYTACYVAVMVHRYASDRGCNSHRMVGILLWVAILSLYAIVTPI